MKKLFLSAILILSIQFVKAQQFTNSGANMYNNSSTTGNLGLWNGTPFTPTEKLHLKTGNILLENVSGAGTGNLYLGSNIGSGGLYYGMRLFFSSTTTAKSAYIDLKSNDANGALIFRTMYTGTTPPERMRITAAGNIGINTTIPAGSCKLTINGRTLIGDPTVVTSFPTAYKLYVQGGILTEMVRVAVANSGAWADYVFEKNYKLRPLSEVEQFIKTEKHLPEVPSAIDVEKNGIDVVEMNSTLLKKIEELTLYVIELKKENDVLTERIDKIEVTNK